MLVNTVGFGLVWTIMTLYFTRVVHLSSNQVGLGLTIASFISMLASIPIGDLADRLGPREVVRMTQLVQGLVTACYLFIHGFAAFLVVASLEMTCFAANAAANGPLLRRVGGENAAAYRSVTRAIGNLGTSLGAVGCAVALAIGTSLAFRTLIAINAATFVVSSAILGRLPRYEALPKPQSRPAAGSRSPISHSSVTRRSPAPSPCSTGCSSYRSRCGRSTIPTHLDGACPASC